MFNRCENRILQLCSNQFSHFCCDVAKSALCKILLCLTAEQRKFGSQSTNKSAMSVFCRNLSDCTSTADRCLVIQQSPQQLCCSAEKPARCKLLLCLTATKEDLDACNNQFGSFCCHAEKPAPRKREVAQPRPGFLIEDAQMQTITPIPYDIIKEGLQQ